MPAGVNPKSAGNNPDSQIQLQSVNRCTADQRCPVNTQSVVNPAKMASPIISAGVEESNHLPGNRIERPNTIGLAGVASKASEPKVAGGSAAAARYWNDVIELHRYTDRLG